MIHSDEEIADESYDNLDVDKNFTPNSYQITGIKTNLKLILYDIFLLT